MTLPDDYTLQKLLDGEDRIVRVGAIGDLLFKRLAPRVYLRDGSSVSIQASDTAYSNPRSSRGPYHAVELGYPSQVFEEFLPFAEEADKPTQTVYGYVPIDLVEQVCDKHGGIDWVWTFLNHKDVNLK
jgi:hypothetical protein